MTSPQWVCRMKRPHNKSKSLSKKLPMHWTPGWTAWYPYLISLSQSAEVSVKQPMVLKSIQLHKMATNISATPSLIYEVPDGMDAAVKRIIMLIGKWHVILIFHHVTSKVTIPLHLLISQFQTGVFISD